MARLIAEANRGRLEIESSGGWHKGDYRCPSGPKTEIIKSSCRIAVIVIEHTAEPLPSADLPTERPDFGSWLDESASTPLMVSLAVVVF